MQLTFFWAEHQDQLSPRCESDLDNPDGVCLLSSILTDDGGLGVTNSTEWLETRLKRISSIVTGESKSLDWNRETFGSTLTSQDVTIYSLHDDSNFEKFGLKQFQLALTEWKTFLELQPSAESSKQIEI